MARIDHVIDTYDACERVLAAGRDSESRKVGPNTFVERRGSDRIAVRFHKTDVVEHRADGLIGIRTGGWWTTTTADRINQALPRPYRVASTRGTWELWNMSAAYRAKRDACSWNGGDHTVTDGMVFDPETNRVISRGETPERIDKDALAAYLDAVTVPEAIPTAVTAGDCFGCLFAIDQGYAAQPMGTDHLWLHIEENYIPGALIVNAFANRGNPGVCASIAISDAKDGRPGMLKDALRAYFRRATTTAA